MSKSNNLTVEKRKGKVMSSAEMATGYVRRMVAKETRGHGDTEGAVHRLAQMIGVDYWPLEHLRRGNAKSVEASLFSRLRGGYIAYCEKQVATLQHEIAVERAIADDVDLAGLESEMAALAAKIKAAKENARGRKR